MSMEKDSGSSDIYGEIRSVFQTKLPELILKYQKQIDNKFVRMDSYFCFDELIESLENAIPEKIDEHDWVDIRNYIVLNVKDFLSKCKFENIYHQGSRNKYLTDIFGQHIINILFDWYSEDGNYPVSRVICNTKRENLYTKKEIKEIIKEELLDFSYIHCEPRDEDEIADCELLEELMNNDDEMINFSDFSIDRIKYSDWSISEFNYNRENFLMPRFR